MIPKGSNFHLAEFSSHEIYLRNPYFDLKCQAIFGSKLRRAR